MKWLYLLMGVMFALLFIGGPDYESHRLFQEIWDLGHIFIFSAFIFAFKSSALLRGMSEIKSFILCLVVSFVTGALIEFLQYFVGRNVELIDVLNDVIGGLIGYLIYGVIYKYPKNIKITGSIIVVFLLVFSSWQLIISLLDEIQMRTDFPALANFESTHQLSRWDNNRVKVSLNQNIIREGKQALYIEFMPDKYPDVSLQHFFSDWSNFNVLKFSLYSPDKNKLTVNLKIYDREHIRNNYKFTDRFNKEIELYQGWNDIDIPLIEVQKAPQNRLMNLGDIKSLSLFMIDVKRTQILILDGIRLE